MKPIKIFAFAALFFGVALASVAFINKNPSPKNLIKADEKGFAVVELFTSEGCSSCPAADELVAKVQKEVAGKPVYILAYHVDYWNRLGWKDVFSSADYSKRQGEYAKWLNLQSVYTPQIVVNGKTEFVGSEEGNLRNAIKAGLQKHAEVQLAFSILKTDHNSAAIQYKVDGNVINSHTVLSLALIQKQATTKVARGENAGRTLAHTQIVRTFQSVPLSKSAGNATLALPAGFNADGYEVIGLVQDTNTGAVLGAAKSAFGATLTANIH